ncbi:hypothetical protein DFH27DRAFT_602468 [Peziza echinospora]|nr:hypothetical protein DFH27DRAFT_602468 [Peziza echinospora]
MEMPPEAPTEEGRSRRRKSARRKAESTDQLLGATAGESSSRHHHRSHRHKDETPEERAARKARKKLEEAVRSTDGNVEADPNGGKSRRKSKRSSRDPMPSLTVEVDGTEEQKHRRRKHRSHPESSTSELQSPKHRHSHHGHHKRKSSSASKSKHRDEKHREEKRGERHTKSERPAIDENGEFHDQLQGRYNDPSYRTFERIEPQNIPNSGTYDSGRSSGTDRALGPMDFNGPVGTDEGSNHRMGRIFSERGIPLQLPAQPRQPTTPPRTRNIGASADYTGSLPTPGIMSPLTPLMSPLQRRAAVRRKRPNELETVGIGMQKLYFDDNDELQGSGNISINTTSLQPQIWNDDGPGGTSISPQISPYMSTEFLNPLMNSNSPLEPKPKARVVPENNKPLPLSCRLPLVIPEAKPPPPSLSPFGGPLQIPNLPARSLTLGSNSNSNGNGTTNVPVYHNPMKDARTPLTGGAGSKTAGIPPFNQSQSQTQSSIPQFIEKLNHNNKTTATTEVPPTLPPRPTQYIPHPQLQTTSSVSPVPLPPPKDFQNSHGYLPPPQPHHHHHHHHQHQQNHEQYQQYYQAPSPEPPSLGPAFGQATGPPPAAGLGVPPPMAMAKGGSFSQKVQSLEARAMNRLHRAREPKHASR